MISVANVNSIGPKWFWHWNNVGLENVNVGGQLLTAQFLNPVKLRPFPSIPFPCKLHQIHPAMVLSEHDVAQLELSMEEYELFIKFVGDLKCMIPQWNAKAPTALHSWGSQLTGCPCGCRDLGCSDLTLSRGIYGRLLQLEGFVEVKGKQVPRMRHPHPVEVAVWNCMVPGSNWPSDLKLLLCGLGQMAIPLQSSWVACQIELTWISCCGVSLM